MKLEEAVKNPWFAFILGLLSFPLLFMVGESLGMAAAFATLAVYFFACQFLMSRGNPAVLREDWLIMLALVAVPLVLFLITALAENREVALSQGLGTLVSCCGGTLAGAMAAALEARRGAVHRPRGHGAG